MMAPEATGSTDDDAEETHTTWWLALLLALVVTIAFTCELLVFVGGLFIAGGVDLFLLRGEQRD